MDTKFILFILLAIIGKSQGNLRCYTCGFSSTDSDRSCLTITNSTPVITCSHTFCTIMRQEFLDPAGVVASFIRTCQNTPVHLNHEVTDDTYRTFFRACTDNFCNVGDGIQSVVGGQLSPTPEYNGINLLVPGTGSAAKIKNNLLGFVIAFIVIITFDSKYIYLN